MLQRTPSRGNPTTTNSKSGITQACVRASKTAASPVRESICLASPDLGGVWGGGVYISENFWDNPPYKPPPRDEKSMMNGGPFCIIIWGGLLMDRCYPATRQMVKYKGLGLNFRW